MSGENLAVDLITFLVIAIYVGAVIIRRSKG